jgi:hypothetical protein
MREREREREKEGGKERGKKEGRKKEWACLEAIATYFLCYLSLLYKENVLKANC